MVARFFLGILATIFITRAVGVDGRKAGKTHRTLTNLKA